MWHDTHILTRLYIIWKIQRIFFSGGHRLNQISIYSPNIWSELFGQQTRYYLRILNSNHSVNFIQNLICSHWISYVESSKVLKKKLQPKNSNLKSQLYLYDLWYKLNEALFAFIVTFNYLRDTIEIPNRKINFEKHLFFLVSSSSNYIKCLDEKDTQGDIETGKAVWMRAGSCTMDNVTFCCCCCCRYWCLLSQMYGIAASQYDAHCKWEKSLSIFSSN